jgi:hypothetical protein
MFWKIRQAVKWWLRDRRPPEPGTFSGRNISFGASPPRCPTCGQFKDRH